MHHVQRVTAYTSMRLGRYELLGKLASGGMGEIHLARLAGDGGFERLVVVKRLLPELVADEQFVAMFLDEARIAGRLSHPNVCEVHELGRDGTDYFIAMPYLEGVAVADLLSSPQDPRLVSAIVAQAAEGLHHAHELRGKDGEPLGLVHRDVSPSNLMVTTAGVVKVLDFGIAKVRGATARTEVGTIKGKYAYMSPEQVRGDDLDRRSDIFALGAIAWELATGQRLFKRPSDFLSAKAILEEPIPRVTGPLADVIARALERDRDARYPTARELATAITAAAPPMDAAGIAAVISADHARELSEQRTRQLRVLATVRARPPRRRAPLALLAAAPAAAAATVSLLPTRGVAPRREQTVTQVPRTGDAAVVEQRAVDAGVAPVDAAAPPDARFVVDEVPARQHPFGWISVDSKPYGTVYLDGKKIGVTPMIKWRAKAGKHRVRVVLEDGRSKSITIRVKEGKLAPPVNLTW